ncbi:choice-of-anchor A family protein [Corynebacterium alimapuense]|nr:choice-of-anchor A family protein [Corynebacterium alimapuense]
MLEHFTRTSEFSGWVKRVLALSIAAFLAIAGMQFVTAPSAAAAEAPYNPIADYIGYNVVAFDDLHIIAESEGPVAVGGKFSFDGSQTIIKQPNSPAALVVKGGIDWGDSTGTHQVNPGENLGVGDLPLSLNLTGSDALDEDSNNASVPIRVVPEDQTYENGTPRIQLNANGFAAANVAYDAAKFDPLFVQGTAVEAANELAEQSQAECQASNTLEKVDNENAAGDGPAYWIDGGKAFVKLKENTQNIWNLDGAEFNSFSEITFRNGPSSATPLFINVSGTNIDFKTNLAGVDPGSNGSSMLWNFHEATELSLNGDSITGSVLAPNAHFDKNSSNVDGNIIVASGNLAGSEQHHVPFTGKFTPCDPSSDEPLIGTSVAVDGSEEKVLPLTGGTVVDTVEYENLTVSQDYLLEGELYTPAGVATGITASETFTPESADGSVGVTFEISAEDVAAYAGQDLVVFEYLYQADGEGNKVGEVVAKHIDPEDEAQTFTVRNDQNGEEPGGPLIGTSVAVDGSEEKVLPLTGGTVVDTVEYENLTVDQDYLLEGELYTPAGVATGITASETFTPESADGSVGVTFEISAEDVAAYAGQDLVVFEYLYQADGEGNKVGEVVTAHDDPEDEAQTFTVAPSEVEFEKKVTGVKGQAVTDDPDALFQIKATWTDAAGLEDSKEFTVQPGEPVMVSGLPLDTEITLSEVGASTSVSNVGWADIIWSGEGVVDGEGLSKDATVVLDSAKDSHAVMLENETSSDGLIIIPIPLPELPDFPGSSTPGDPIEPGTPGTPSAPSYPGKPGQPVSPEKEAEHTDNVNNQDSGLANTGANVAWIAGGALALILGGAWLVLRNRKNQS